MTRSNLGRRWLVAAVATVLFGACRVEVDVAVEAGADGVGTVAVMVRLDADAAAQVPDPTSLFEVADLRAAGWAVEAPEVAPGGAVTVRAEKPFGDIAGAAVALAELSGPDGPFGSLRLDQERTVVGTRTSLEGRVDLSGGLGAFSDPALQERLGGLPLGADPAELERELGVALADVFGFRLHAALPGRSATVTARLGQSVPVTIAGSRLDFRRVVLVAVSVGSGLALVAVLWRRRRPRGRHSPH
ncbi:MAG TPA: hypothetical protein VM264_05060 [Acidimicrobiales bacterium]|nr:hypothetical protein [Acidimicrobiales bacterium]